MTRVFTRSSFVTNLFYFLTMLALLFIVLTPQAHAGGNNYHGGSQNGFGIGGEFGGSADISGASNWSGSAQAGNAWTNASTESYGQSESAFGATFQTNPSKFAAAGNTLTGSGSRSTALSGSAGNGFGSSSTGGLGYGAGGSFGGSGALTQK